jgi:starch phosphorylase
MPRVYAYHVSPRLPERLRCLNDLSLNLRWTWHHPTVQLFQRLDSDLWEATFHNPRLMLSRIDQRRLAEIESDEAFLAHMDRVSVSLEEYLGTRGWFLRAHPEASSLVLAYFSAEYGLTECIPTYAGGLGILAGDHLKASSDLGMPLTGVGLLYQGGYFRQYLNADGWQQETHLINDFHNLPLQPVEDGQGNALMVEVAFPGRRAFARVWRVQVGRVPLYLLDTNVKENSPEDRKVTGALYSDNQELRLQQEIVLGIGGMRALRALGIRPTACHMNEGHSAFLGLERTRLLMEELGLPYYVARQIGAAGNIFTTHTPVSAGIDRFAPELMKKYFCDYAQSLGLAFDELMTYGRHNPRDPSEALNMAYLAARHSSYMNGVSRIHGDVTRLMAHPVWRGYPLHEVPIGYVSNGIHIHSWISREMSGLLDRYLGPKWSEDPTDRQVWNRIDRIPDQELWMVHRIRKERLINYARTRLAAQIRQRGGSTSEIAMADSVLGPGVLTIGFARRFATYKRALLLLTDTARLKRILTDPKRPVQILFAGKAHPHDHEAKDLIRRVIHFARDPEVRHRVVFLEDYDISVARYLVQGVDVWLNTPRRPNEASGTSGMKVLCNGGLNLSVLDGWWEEGYDREVGWAIGQGEVYPDNAYQDSVESSALYSLLENDVVPLFYDRDAADIPRGWLGKVKASMKKLTPVFNTNRMVAEYAERFYLAASARHLRLRADNGARALALVEWRKRLHVHDSEVRVARVDIQTSHISVGSKLGVTARVFLGHLAPSDVRVQIYYGRVDPEGQITRGQAVDMQLRESLGAEHLYECGIDGEESGSCGFSVRVVPFHEDAILPYEFPWIVWQEEAVQPATDNL